MQDTGPDGAWWALALRGVAVGADGDDELALAWTLRGAPHAYRRQDLAEVAVATAPWSEADAAKRIINASKPLEAADRSVIEALRELADRQRALVVHPTVKGDLSGALNDELEEAFLHFCRPCDATHVYEMPFRLAALQAGLELEAGTSPPVLCRGEGLEPNRFERLAGEADPQFDVVRGVLRFFGPATPKEVSTFLDAPTKDVNAHWPDDAVVVEVDGHGPARGRFLLHDDIDALADAAEAPSAANRVVRLVGPYDALLQGRDRELLVLDPARRKELWPVLGRPGAVLVDGEIVATWRPKTSGPRLTVRLEPWQKLTKVRKTEIEDQAQRLAEHRGVELAGVVDES